MTLTLLDRIGKLANRLAQLNPKDRTMVALVSIAVGALYGLASALKLGYSGSRAEMPQVRHVMKVAVALARRQVPQDRLYLGGYYFNDSLLRLDIAFENALLHFTDLHDLEEPGHLIAAATSKGLEGRRFDGWKKIRREVNALKHRNPEQVELHATGGTIAPGTAVSAAEELVSFIERVVPARNP